MVSHGNKVRLQITLDQKFDTILELHQRVQRKADGGVRSKSELIEKAIRLGLSDPVELIKDEIRHLSQQIQIRQDRLESLLADREEASRQKKTREETISRIQKYEEQT